MESAGKLNFSGGCTSFDLLHSRGIRVDKLATGAEICSSKKLYQRDSIRVVLEKSAVYKALSNL